MLSWSDPGWAATVGQVVWVERGEWHEAGSASRPPGDLRQERPTGVRVGKQESGEVRVPLSFPETPSQMHPEATGSFPHKEQDPKHHSLEVSTQTRGRHQGSSLLPQGPSNVCSAQRPLISCRKDEDGHWPRLGMAPLAGVEGSTAREQEWALLSGRLLLVG